MTELPEDHSSTLDDLLGGVLSPPRPPDPEVVPEAGWYAHPSNPGLMRYSDGSRWTIEGMPIPTAPPPPAEVALPGRPELVVVDSDDSLMVLDSGSDADVEAPSRQVAHPDDTMAPGVGSGPGIIEDHGADPVTVKRHVAPLQRGPHFVFGFDTDHDGVTGPDPDEDRATLVTGEVPPGYGQVTLECEGGDVVTATFVDPATLDDARIFVALVRHRVRRVVATQHRGAYGIFFDVALLKKGENTASPMTSF